MLIHGLTDVFFFDVSFFEGKWKALHVTLSPTKRWKFTFHSEAKDDEKWNEESSERLVTSRVLLTANVLVRSIIEISASHSNL